MKLFVFISHNKADKGVAREISLFITSENINVWFDEWEISVGDSIVKKINTGLANCSHFIILWSKSALKSSWVGKEVESILAKAINTGTPKILPILLDDAPIPDLLADLKYSRYRNGIEEDRRQIIKLISGEYPSQNFIRAVVKKYHEVILDNRSDGNPLPFVACPQCGGSKLKQSDFLDYERDDTWFTIKCKECGWSEATQ